MNIPRAIEIKEAYHKRLSKHMLAMERRADKLSIEALKRHLNAEGHIKNYLVVPLPGETKD